MESLSNKAAVVDYSDRILAAEDSSWAEEKWDIADAVANLPPFHRTRWYVVRMMVFGRSESMDRQVDAGTSLVESG